VVFVTATSFEPTLVRLDERGLEIRRELYQRETDSARMECSTRTGSEIRFEVLADGEFVGGTAAITVSQFLDRYCCRETVESAQALIEQANALGRLDPHHLRIPPGGPPMDGEPTFFLDTAAPTPAHEVFRLALDSLLQEPHSEESLRLSEGILECLHDSLLREYSPQLMRRLPRL